MRLDNIEVRIGIESPRTRAVLAVDPDILIPSSRLSSPLYLSLTDSTMPAVRNKDAEKEKVPQLKGKEGNPYDDASRVCFCSLQSRIFYTAEERVLKYMKEVSMM